MHGKRLDGWKAVARYLNRDVRTVQRWERSRHLPVHRVPGGDLGAVYAYAAELDAWLGEAASGRGGQLALASSGAAGVLAFTSPGLLVLPFSYHGADARLAFLGDSIASEVITRLSASDLRRLRVLSWTTACACRDSPQAAGELARRFGVRYIVEGDVLSAGDEWRVDVRIVDARADRTLVAHRMRCGAREGLVLQGRIAEAIAAEVELTSFGGSSEVFWNNDVDPTALLCFLKGVKLEASGNEAAMSHALELYREALRIAPEYVPAKAHIGSTLLMSSSFTGCTPPETRSAVQQLLAECMAAGPHLQSVTILDAMVAIHRFDWQYYDSRLSELQSALPALVVPRARRAYGLRLRKQFAAADGVVESLASLEDSVYLRYTEAVAKIWTGSYDAAERELEVVLQMAPSHANAQLMLLVIALYRSNTALARRLFSDFPVAMQQRFGVWFTGITAALEGRVQQALEARASLAARAASGQAYWYHVAWIDAALGNPASTARSLEMAAARHEGNAVHAGVDKIFDDVRDDEQVGRVLRSMNLAA